MKIYVIGALVALALLLAGNTALQKLDAAKAENSRLSEKLDQAERDTKAANAVVLELKNNLKLERDLQATLQKQQSELRLQLTSRNLLVEQLKRENKELSDWAINGLPTAVKWLRERPAITGAADYQNWLSSRNSLHPDSDQTAEQRQPAN